MIAENQLALSPPKGKVEALVESIYTVHMCAIVGAMKSLCTNHAHMCYCIYFECSAVGGEVADVVSRQEEHTAAVLGALEQNLV